MIIGGTRKFGSSTIHCFEKKNMRVLYLVVGFAGIFLCVCVCSFLGVYVILYKGSSCVCFPVSVLKVEFPSCTALLRFCFPLTLCQAKKFTCVCVFGNLIKMLRRPMQKMKKNIELRDGYNQHPFSVPLSLKGLISLVLGHFGHSSEDCC